MRQLKITQQVTNRDTKSLEKYFQEISKIEMITADEEVDLAIKIKKGDAKALNTLVNANLRFVVSVAKQYQNQGLKLSDLINEGNIGLVKAAKRFDETRGFKFISYAVWWIRQSILQALSKKSRVVRLPQNKVGSIRKINSTYSKIEQHEQRMPDAEEIAKSLGMTTREVKSCLANSKRHLSMDAPFKEGENSNLYDVISANEAPKPDKALMQESLATDIDNALETLSQNEAMVIEHFFGLNKKAAKSLSEIGEKLDISRERVRQVKNKALKRLQNTSRSHILKAYLG